MAQVFIERFAFFVPSEEQPAPNVSFVPMLTRRRLSPLCKLVVSVSKPVSENLPHCKVTFASQFGEISQQLKISQALLETGTVSPAHFSLSVFNASIANASILEKNTAGYSAVFSGSEAFRSGLADCVAALCNECSAGKSANEECVADSRMFIFADELIPETYAPVAGVKYPNANCALALRLTTDKSKALAELDYSPLAGNFETAAAEATAFIEQRIKPLVP